MMVKKEEVNSNYRRCSCKKSKEICKNIARSQLNLARFLDTTSEYTSEMFLHINN